MTENQPDEVPMRAAACLLFVSLALASRVAAKETSVEERLTRFGAEVSTTEITLRLPGAILFDFGSADLRTDAERTFAELAQVLTARSPRPSRVEGHTDSVADNTTAAGRQRSRRDALIIARAD